MRYFIKLSFFDYKALIFIIFSCITNHALGQSAHLSLETINDFSYNAYREFNYGNGSFRYVIVRGLSQMGYEIADMHIAIEQLSKNRKYQNDILYVIRKSFGGNDEFLFLNLVSMNIKAVHAKQIVDYIKKQRKEKIIKPSKSETTYIFENSISVPKGYTIHSSEINSSLNRTSFETLKKYNHKYPTSSGFFQNLIVVNELKRLLSSDYAHFIKEKYQWSKETQIEIIDNILFSYMFSGGEDQPHLAIFCDLEERKTYILMAELIPIKRLKTNNIESISSYPDFKIRRSIYGDLPFTNAVKNRISELIQQESDYGFKEQKLDSLLIR